MQGEFYVVRAKSELDMRLDYLKQNLNEMDEEIFPIAIQVKKFRSKRSLNQNNLFYLWCGEAAEYFNRKKPPNLLDKEDMHDLFCHLFLGCEDKMVGSTVIKGKLRGTRNLDTGDMFYLMEQVDAWCHEKGCRLTIPVKSEYYELQQETTR